MSALRSEYYAPDLRRSVIVAVHEYELMYGKKPAVIFAGSKAFQELTRELRSLPTTDYILFAKIPLKLSPVEEDAVYLAGDPVKIRPTKQYE